MRNDHDLITLDLFSDQSKPPSKTGHVTPFPVAEPAPLRRSPRRPRNADVRSPREYLTPDEVERLMRAARSVGRHRHRDAALILIGYRHGLRVSELVSLRWDQIDLMAGLTLDRLPDARL